MKLRPRVAFTLLFSLSIIVAVFLVGLSSANFFPDPVPAGIQITSGGAVVGTEMIQRSGDVYTLTGDIYVTIVILRDGIVLDGGGCALRGSGSGTGVFLQERNNVVIQNMKIVNFSYGIKFTWLNYGSPTAQRSNTVSGNTLINNTYGIAIYDFSEGNQILDNYFERSTYGVTISSSSHSVFRNNQFWDSGGILDSGQDANDIDTSNTVNGRPVYYWANQHDKTLPSDAGWVVLKNCSGITVQGLNLQGNPQGVLLYYTNDSTIIGNVITNNLEGVALRISYGNVISGNRISDNKGCGISLEYGSNNNTITRNEIASNANDGVNFGYYTINATVAENHVTENGGNGIFFHDIQDSTVIGNNVTRNKGCGIGFGYGPNGIIKQNHITRNVVGVWLSNAHDNIITWNNILENAAWGIRLEGAQGNNTIHHNNFINNSLTEALQASVLGIWTYPGFGKPPQKIINGSLPTPEPPIFAPGGGNFWDDGREGNYWSDYTVRYPNASSVGTWGIGDTPYFINENNFDRYPLMSPVAVSEPHTGPATETPSTPPADTTTPEQVQGSAEAITTEYALAATAFGGIITTSIYLFLKHKRPTAKTERT